MEIVTISYQTSKIVGELKNTKMSVSILIDWLESVFFRSVNQLLLSLFSSGRYLKVLEIPMSGVNDKIVEKFAESLANLTVLDISYCFKITHLDTTICIITCY